MTQETAMKILKELHDKSLYSERTALETIFPELKENEDEKIVNEIISYLNSRVATSEETELLYFKRWIAWLEKQGESYTKKDVDDAYLKGICDAKHELEKQGESSDQIHYWTEEEIEPIIHDYLRGVEHYGGMIGRLRCLKPKSLEKQGGNPASININKMVMEYSQTKDGDFGLPVNCQIRAYRQGLTDAISTLNFEKQGNSSVKWQKNTPDNKPAVNHSILMKTIQGIAEGEWQGEHWFQYRWSWTFKDSEVLAWMELSDLNEQGEQKPVIDFKAKNWYVSKVDGKIHDMTYNPTDKVEPFDKYKGLTDFERTIADICIGWIGEELGWKQYIKDNADVLLKIAIEKFNSIQDAPFEQKSAAWSDEDEKMYKIALSCIETLEDISNGKNMHADVKEWLKRIKDRIGG